jgi:hypothetical protein
MSFGHPSHLPSAIVTQNLTSLAVESAVGGVSKYSTKCAVSRRNALRLVVQKGDHAARAQGWTQSLPTTEEVIYIV